MANALQLAGKSPELLESFSRRLPERIEDALDFPVLKETISAAGEGQVRAYIEFELIKLANLVSVGGNLNNAQVEFIAKELIRAFPNESLADFKICFQRGAIGQYGEIYRMDGIVLRQWMEKYLEEKYNVAEDKLYAEKESQKELYNWQGAAIPAIESNDEKVKEKLAEWKKTIEAAKPTVISPLTDEQVSREGKARPERKAPYTPKYDAEYWALKDRIRKAGQEFYRDRYTVSGMRHFTIKDQEVFAESEDDAIKIYENAKQQKP